MKAPGVEESSHMAQEVFDRAAARGLHLALVQMPVAFLRREAGIWPSAANDAMVTCLRSVLMKPEHLTWVDEIWKRLDQAAG